MKTTDDIGSRLIAIANGYGIDEIDVSLVKEEEVHTELCAAPLCATFRYRVFAWAESPADGSSFTVTAHGGTMGQAVDNFEYRLKEHLSMLARFKEDGR